MINSNYSDIAEVYRNIFPDLEESEIKLYVYRYTPVFVNNIYNQIKNDLDILKEYDKIILETSTEAPHFEDLFFFENVLKNHGINDIMMINSGLDDDFNSKIVYNPLFISYDSKDFVPLKNRDKLYASLSRLVSCKLHRLYITYELYKNNLLDDGIVTCGSAIEDNLKKDTLTFFPDDFLKIIPLCYDGMVVREEVSTNFMTIGDKCLINLVNETSFDLGESVVYPGLFFNGNYAWTRPFITEKTTKAFNSGQIPIFLSVKGYVSILKSMGYDMFEDIIDHSYDNNPNPDVRISMVVNEIKRLKNIGLNKLKLIYGLEDRLLYNKNHTKTLFNDFDKRYKLQIRSWFFTKK